MSKTANIDEVGQYSLHLDFTRLHFITDVVELDVDVLGTFSSAKDVVTPLDARCVVPVYRRRPLLRESETVQKSSEIQDLAASH